jgi:hypothetical protein
MPNFVGISTLKRGLRKIARRLLDSAGVLRSVKGEAPYRRVGKASNGLHRPVLLNLETSDGSGQACHPDVLYIPGGFGSKRWTYWMACTPYPNKESSFENPEIFASYDGISWAMPDGAQNPLVPTPAGAGDHNSDPDVVFHENQLWLFYRETLRSGERGKDARTQRRKDAKTQRRKDAKTQRRKDAKTQRRWTGTISIL